jgi:GWxTD domain-containing protein
MSARHVVLLALGLLIARDAAAARSELRKWVDGPIRYIARKEEAKMFRSLETDEARAIFVEKFWRRRDPTPETLANEYRELFWHRVQEANSNFTESAKPGWMTDRGKIHILYGPPTDVENFNDLQSERTEGRGVIRWIYQGRPGQRTDMNPIVVVAFQKDAGGEYRVSYDPDLTSVFFDANAMAENDRFDRFYEVIGATTKSELSVMLDLGRMQEVPPAEQVLIESVETAEAYETLPLEVEFARYFRPEDGTPLAVINVDLLPFAFEERPAIVARFVPRDASAGTRVLGEDSFQIAEQDGYRLAQGRLALEPGDYTVTVVVADALRAKTGMHQTTITLPARPEAMRLSDPVWAVAVEPVEYASLSSYDEPFHLGPFRVLPKTGSTYKRGETIKLFVEVVGASYPLRATFQLEGREDDGSWTALGQPATAEQTAGELAWEVPTAERWPPGAYRVRVDVRDAAGGEISTQAELTLE